MTEPRFWDFKACAKHDEIEEWRSSHRALLHGALTCQDTGVTACGRDEYILYDREGNEALLYRPGGIIGRVGMRLYRAVAALTSTIP